MMILLMDNYNKKAWRSVPVTRPMLRGSRIAQYSRTSKHKLILSSSTDKPLTTTKLSSATSDAKGANASIYEAIRKKVQEIADCGKNDSKDTI